MAKRDARMVLRGNTWHLRVKVPGALRPLIGRSEFTKSLRTSNLAEARRILALEVVKVDAELSAARRKLAAKPVTALSRLEMEHLLASPIPLPRHHLAQPIAPNPSRLGIPLEDAAARRRLRLFWVDFNILRQDRLRL